MQIGVLFSDGVISLKLSLRSDAPVGVVVQDIAVELPITVVEFRCHDAV